MARIYATLIRKGEKTIEDVPERLRAEMAVVYATLIIKGKKTIDQVPARLRKQVEEILEACEVEI